MSKHKEAFKRIKSVIDSHLLFSEWLQHESNWGGYIKSVNNIDAELKFDEDMYIIDDLVDRATPKKPYLKENRITKLPMEICPQCHEFVVNNYRGKYCGCCGQAILWEE